MIKIFKNELFENFMKEHHLSKTKFCQLCGISPCVLKKIFNQQLNFRSSSLIKISKFTKIKIQEMLVE